MKPKEGVRASNSSSSARHVELRRLLEDRRREIVATVNEGMRAIRADDGMDSREGVLDDGEVSDADIQGDIELALIQMRAETLGQIDEAIARLEAGVYGQCAACGEEIASARLRALPFAVRCRRCEEHQETERRRAQTDQGHPFFGDRGSLRDLSRT